MKDEKRIFPFEFVNLPVSMNSSERKKPFVKTVEEVLSTDLQLENTFGCRIKNCHTHAGSKIHFDDFIEAELLFHNWYYNHGFSVLTVDRILKKMEQHPSKNIVLIGYENYSELYLQEVKTRLKEKKYEVDCFVYETKIFENENKNINEDVRIRKLFSNKSPNEDDFFVVFIVPINTTLSTMDKMISKFRYIHKEYFNIKTVTDYICLITIGPTNHSINEFWEIDKTSQEFIILKPTKNIFSALKENDVVSFSYIESSWHKADSCTKCYPMDLIKEEALFGVNKASVVPMLMLDVNSPLKPSNEEELKLEKENLKRLSKLTKFLLYNHIVRDNNHYQFYFDTVSYFEYIKEDKDLGDSIKVFREKQIEVARNCTIFNYIVSPRHMSNSGWIHYAIENLFPFEEVRMLYFDVDKEYRSNIKAKYSDFTQTISNLIKNNFKCEIRFHFVDDTINSGSTFLRVKNILSSLIPKENSSNVHIHLFFSIILLVSRISKNTQKFYLESNFDNFYSYVHFSISPMRKFNDSCTLCKLTNDLMNIKKSCSTNELNNFFANSIIRHEIKNIFASEINTKEPSIEKKLIFLLTHLLTERMKNNLILFYQNDENPINCNFENAKDSILEILEKYYSLDAFYRFNKGVFNKEIWGKKKSDDKYIYYCIAFIKAISRPFFINHFRHRQAVFNFCITKLDCLLRKDFFAREDLCLIKTFVKALTDLEANYLIRESIILKLVCAAEKGEEIKLHEQDKYYEKNIFDKKSLMICLKKLLILSRETTKSVKLENFLITGHEAEDISVNSKQPFFINDKVYKKIYLENNRILFSVVQTAQDLDNAIKNIPNKPDEPLPYFLCYFSEIWKKNTQKKLQDSITILEKFLDIKKRIALADKELTVLDDSINDFFEIMCEKKEEYDKNNILNITTFLVDANDSFQDRLDVFKYYMLKLDDEKSWDNLKKLEDSRRFYYEENINIINVLLKYKTSSDADFKDNDFLETGFFYLDSKKTLFIKFNGNLKKEDTLYFEIRNFEIRNLTCWFAIKMFMTLRNDFGNLIDKINISVLAKSRNLAMQRRALSINKALTHTESDRYYDFFHSPNASNKEDFSDLQMKHKYYQILSNEFISSIYRKIIKGELYDKDKDPAKISIIQKNIDEFFEFLCPNSQEKYLLWKNNVKVKINIEYPKAIDNFSILEMAGLDQTGMSHTFIFIILLMAMNTAKHSQLEIPSMKITFDTKKYYICFENEINSNAEVSKEEIMKKIQTPPWCYDDKSMNQSITLWSVYHSKFSKKTSFETSFMASLNPSLFIGEEHHRCLYQEEDGEKNFCIDVSNKKIKILFKLLI